MLTLCCHVLVVCTVPQKRSMESGWMESMFDTVIRSDFHLFSCKLDLMVPSYDEKAQKVRDY